MLADFSCSSCTSEAFTQLLSSDTFSILCSSWSLSLHHRMGRGGEWEGRGGERGEGRGEEGRRWESLGFGNGNAEGGQGIKGRGEKRGRRGGGEVRSINMGCHQ